MSDKYINESGLQTIKTWVESKIPTATSDLTNDSGFITASDIPQELFWCTYDSTTYTEIATAITNGKFPIVIGSGMYGIYSHHSNSTYFFVYTLQTRIYYFSCDSNDEWGMSSTIIAPKDSPALTGTPTAPTATSGTNTTQIATTEFVQTAISEKQGTITANGILKGNGSGTISAAVAGTDYQAPLTAGTDYQTPLVAGTDYQTPLPSQSGNNGKFLTTNGSAMSWESIPSDSSKQNKITASGILKGDGSGGVSAAVAGTDYQSPLTAGTDYQAPLPSQTGNNGKFLTTNGSDLSWATVSGGSSGVFVAEYGTTSYSDITSAYSAGKFIMVTRSLNGTTMYLFADIDSSGTYYFRSFSNQSATNYGCYINSSGTWAVNSYTYATLSSPAFTGNPTAPTQTAGNNSTRIATTAFVTTAISNAITATLAGEY